MQAVAKCYCIYMLSIFIWNVINGNREIVDYFPLCCIFASVIVTLDIGLVLLQTGLISLTRDGL